MDSRVAITAASILYDIQNLPEDAPKHPDFVDEDFSQLSGQFLSCNWRLNDTDEEPDTQIQSTQMLEFQVPKNGQRIDYNVTTLQALPELSINGVDRKFLWIKFIKNCLSSCCNQWKLENRTQKTITPS